MGLIVTSNFHALLLFLWVASVLTSPVNNEAKTDGTLSTSTWNETVVNASSRSDQRSSSSTVQMTAESTSVTKSVSMGLQKNVTEPPFLGEGGPISVSSSTQHVANTIPQLLNISDALNSKEVMPKEKTDYQTTGRNVTQSKIVPRKGADLNDMTLPNGKTFRSNDTKPVVEPSVGTDLVHTNEYPNIANTDNTKANITTKHINESASTDETINLHDTSISQQNTTVSVIPKTSSTTKLHKPKPTATIGGNEVDGPMPVSSPKSSPFGMPRKIDYIVPVVITIVALPLLGAATYIVYRRGRDCWDKRHYRRMDFLIDGMYND